MTLAEYLRTENLSTNEFAKRAGVSQPHVWQIANGAACGKDAAEKIEAATRGKVTRLELLYPASPSGGAR